MAIVKLHSRKLTTQSIRSLIRRGYKPVYSSKQINLQLVFHRIRELMDLNITLRSLSNKSSFEILDGKLYLYIDVDEINSFETARLLVQLDKHRMKVQNYNVDLKGRDVWD